MAQIFTLKIQSWIFKVSSPEGIFPNNNYEQNYIWLNLETYKQEVYKILYLWD